ncbi:Protein_phosphatase 2C [Hexamita inflata]|uniref:Protein phosphatase 2C n=1 Tax=Hexamita inflata TaxID=28002 RepID=A0AA86N4V1_9EUKA|nr:Protein phosphatase 2C [Hexamita inflata]
MSGRNLTFIYSEEQIEEIGQQLPQNIQTCRSRIEEIDQQLEQYNDLIKQLDDKIRRADSLIAERCRDQPDLSSFVSEPLSVNCTTVTGRRSSNEDEEVATIVRVDGQQRYQFLGVFDGHGGIDAASYCKQQLLKKLIDTKFIGFGQLGLALQEAIIQTDQAYCEQTDKGQVGTTVACCLIDLKRGLVVAANSGDARVLIKTKSSIYTTVDHKPSDERERARLRDNFNTGVFDFGGVMRVNGTLAVSRAIGDLDFKIYGVLALPQIYEEIQYSDVNFVVVACDGMWDVISNEEAVQAVESCITGKVVGDSDVAKAVFAYFNDDLEEGDKILKSESDPAELESLKVNKKDITGKISQSLVRAAFVKNSQDNITCIVAIVDK